MMDGGGDGIEGETMSVSSRPGDRSSEGDFNVFVTNFPGNFSSKELRNTCQRFGKVSSVFVAKKLNKHGRNFGFVRFPGSVDIDVIIDKICNTRFGQIRLYANIARFARKDPSKENRKETPRHEVPLVHHAVHSVAPMGVSYAAAVTGNGKQNDEVIMLDTVMQLEKPLSVVGCVDDFGRLPNMQNLCVDQGFLDVSLKYIGGLWVLFEFQSSDAMYGFMGSDNVKQWFSDLRPWSSDFMVKERLAWVEVEGMSFLAWNEGAFDKVLAKYGRIIVNDCGDVANFYSKQVCMLTSCQENIIDNLKVSCNGVTSIIRIREVIGWIPEFAKVVDDNSNSQSEGVEREQFQKYDGEKTVLGTDLSVEDDEKQGECGLKDVVADVEDGPDNVDQEGSVNGDHEGSEEGEVHGDESLGTGEKVERMVRDDAFVINHLVDHGVVKVNEDSGVVGDSRDARPMGEEVASRYEGFSLIEKLQKSIMMGKSMGLSMKGMERALQEAIEKFGEDFVVR